MKTIRREQTDKEKAASARGRRSVSKGKVYESSLHKRLLAEGYKAYRGIQGKRGGKNNPDILVCNERGDPYFHIECKRGKHPNAKKALEQATQDARPDMIPVAVCCQDAPEIVGCRLKGEKYTTELVTMHLSDWITLIGCVLDD